VLLSSHILAEVEALCDRVSIIRSGRTVESGTLAHLRHLTRTSITVETVDAPAGIDGLPGVHDLVVDDHHARFDVDAAHLAAVIQRVAPLDTLTVTPLLTTGLLAAAPAIVGYAGLRRRDVGY
jgi:ABC-2 type transport system ATP-binding protein